MGVRAVAAGVATALLVAAAPAPAQTGIATADPLPSRPTCDRMNPLPSQFRLEFAAQASLGPLAVDGDTELTFRRNDDRYTLRSDTRAPMVGAEQRSSGRIVIEGAAGARRVLLIPAEFVERSGRRDPRTVRIEGAGGRVSFSANAGEPATAPAGLQDKLSLLLQAGQQLRIALDGAAPGASGASGASASAAAGAHTNTAAAKAPIDLPVAGARRISTYRLLLRGAETLDLPAGRIETWKLERPRDAEHDGLEAWVAPSLCWLPVRLRFTDERGTVIENRLRAARFD
jgi:hypothetical protein